MERFYINGKPVLQIYCFAIAISAICEKMPKIKRFRTDINDYLVSLDKFIAI